MDHWLDSLSKAGVKSVYATVHHHPDLFSRYVSARRLLFNITLLNEPVLLGSAGSVAAHCHTMDVSDDELVIVVYGDNLSTVSISDMANFHRQHSKPMTMLLFRTNKPKQCGIVDVDSHGHITSFEEKPACPKSNLANAGVYMMDGRLFKSVASMQAFDFGHDVIPKLVGQMAGYCPEGLVHIDVGTEDNLILASEKAKKFETSLWTRKAIFFDRDDTLVHNIVGKAPYNDIRPTSHAHKLVSFAKGLSFKTLLVTNQGAVQDGLITESDVEEANQKIVDMFGLDGAYYAPYRDHIDRKPGPGMFWKAAIDHCLDLRDCWMVGDFMTDVEASTAAGCAGTLHLNYT